MDGTKTSLGNWGVRVLNAEIRVFQLINLGNFDVLLSFVYTD